MVAAMIRPETAIVALLALALPLRAQAEESRQADAAGAITIEQIMSDPDWIGREPEAPYWSADSNSVYYSQKRVGAAERDLFRIELSTGAIEQVPLEQLGQVDAPGANDWSEYDRLRTRRVYTMHGDLFVKNLQSGHVQQLTRTVEREYAAAFMLDESKVQFARNGELYVRDLLTGLEYQPAELRFEEDPYAEDSADDNDYLERQQERLLRIISERKRREHSRRDHARELQESDPSRTPHPWYLGKGHSAEERSLSPDGRWMLLSLVEENNAGGERDLMPEFVTESSWVSTRKVRPHVGHRKSKAFQFVLLDLKLRKRVDLDFGVLPDIGVDRLAFLKDEQAGQSDSKPEDPDRTTPPRPINIQFVSWAPDASSVAFMARSEDNKDRWIARVDLEQGAIVPIHHLVDEAWIGWRFNELGWYPDSSGLWFTSEESGWSQLYSWEIAGNTIKALTKGSFEIDRVQLAPDGTSLFYRANPTHPGISEVFRLQLASGQVEALTQLGGRISYELAPSGEELLLTHSKPLSPPELFVQPARAGATPRQLTTTVSSAFRSLPWTAPKIVDIPSRRGDLITARVYEPKTEGGPARPAVAFVHGAGYLQNAHHGWSGYFREFMFHSLLTQEGFVVIDVDYRASAGYGRDWRTAIYRQMGTPELEDYQDCLQWLVENANVDAARIGVYGGSYGGFLALMALFQRPEMFACGAALRPVTDWAHYNHGYTSNILNTPEVDPEAFERSSPIEFAEGLEKPLLICHGMLDDNVIAKDSIRLAQRLIELEKEDWEMALYPIEPHGFREPSSWLDEYRRILKLFRTHLK